MNTYFANDRHFKTSSACIQTFCCVAVAISPEHEVAVRNSSDSKKATIVFNKDEWNAFIKGVKNGEFDLN